MKYSFEIARTSTGKYVCAVSSADGYAHYKLYNQTKYFQRKIRGVLEYFQNKGGLDLPRIIKWDDLPNSDFIIPVKEIR